MVEVTVHGFNTNEPMLRASYTVGDKVEWT